MRPVAGFTRSAGHLFGIAREACAETKGGAHDRETGRQKALISVVFSVATLEAFINELAGMADAMWKDQALFMGRPREDESRLLQALSAALLEAEQEQASTKLKYLLAHWILAGKPFNRGTFPFQDFVLLLALRNHVLHLRLESWEYDEEGKLLTEERLQARLRSKNIQAILETPTTVPVSWAIAFETHAAARWACNTTIGMVKSISNLVPEGVFKDSVVKTYARILYEEVD